MNKLELCKAFGVAESVINTNFPKFAKKQLERGFLITKTGKGNSANYEISKVKPQEVDKSFFSSKKNEVGIDLEGEIWIDCCIPSQYEVSDLGRIRHKTTKVLLQGSINDKGYQDVSILSKNYRLHRIILQSFDPREDWMDYQVDHINGIRTDNRLENLRWVTNEENTLLMKMNRLGLNKEVTRIINKYGYEQALELLQKL